MQRQGPEHNSLYGTAGKSSDGFKKWIVRFFASKAFDTLAPGDVDASRAGSLSEERIGKSGFSDARFARHENNLPVSAKDALEMTVERLQR
jgi:hypothetical protein